MTESSLSNSNYVDLGFAVPMGEGTEVEEAEAPPVEAETPPVEEAEAPPVDPMAATLAALQQQVADLTQQLAPTPEEEPPEPILPSTIEVTLPDDFITEDEFEATTERAGLIAVLRKAAKFGAEQVLSQVATAMPDAIETTLTRKDALLQAHATMAQEWSSQVRPEHGVSNEILFNKEKNPVLNTALNEFARYVRGAHPGYSTQQVLEEAAQKALSLVAVSPQPAKKKVAPVPTAVPSRVSQRQPRVNKPTADKSVNSLLGWALPEE